MFQVFRAIGILGTHDSYQETYCQNLNDGKDCLMQRNNVNVLTSSRGCAQLHSKTTAPQVVIVTSIISSLLEHLFVIVFIISDITAFCFPACS